MAKKKRVKRKQLLKEPDEFLTLSAKAIGFVTNNQKPVLGVIIGVVVVALALAGFRYFSSLSERKAYTIFEQGRLHYLAEISGDKTAAAQEKAAEQFEEVIREYPSTNAARFTLLVYADMSYHRGDHQRAIELYQKALRAFSGEGDIQKLIWVGLAYAYEAKGDYKSAAEYFERITDTKDEFMKADACYNLGRIMEALNNQEKALEAYNKVVQAYPDSAGFRIAKEKVFRLKGAPVASELSGIRGQGSANKIK
jgi:tetratricopeptide (TPR) repeat protein